MSIGSARLLEEWGSPLKIAEALLLGKLSSYDQQFVRGTGVDEVMLSAAKFRIEKGLNKTEKPEPTAVPGRGKR